MTYTSTEFDYEGYPLKGNESSDPNITKTLIEFDNIIHSLLEKHDSCNLEDIEDDIINGHLIIKELENLDSEKKIKGAHKAAYNDYVTDYYQTFADIHKQCACIAIKDIPELSVHSKPKKKIY